MDGFEYLNSETQLEVSGVHLFIFVVAAFSTVFPILMINKRCHRKQEEPLLPITDDRVISYPTQNNPFLKLRMNAFSAAEEQMDRKPLIIV
jgi:hypothetical protein